MTRTSVVTLIVSILLEPLRALGQGRVFLGKADVEVTIVGKPLVSRNLASGIVSTWLFRPDGTVEAMGAAGKAVGTWHLYEDGRMCVHMLGRSACRYWFWLGESLANAESREPGARAMAEVSVR